MTSPTSKVPESVSNPYSYYVDVIIDLLGENTETTASHAAELKILTNTSESLSSAWTTEMPSSSTSSSLNIDIGNGLAQVNAGTMTMASFISTYLTKGYLPGFSSELGIKVMTTLSNHWDKNAGPGQMNIINQWNSLISGKAQNEESTGQNDSKTESSVVQQDAGDQQIFVDAGNSVSGVMGNFASLLQQPY